MINNLVFRCFAVLAFCICFLSPALSQIPANDNCSNAKVITIPNNGFATGIFSSSIDDLTQATVQTGETFAPAILVAGQNKKSVWYKFTLPTTRTARVTLVQPGIAITAGDAGFAVYKTNTCLPITDSLSTKLTPIATFGNTYHPCVDPGDYLVQVSSNAKANGPIQIQVQLSDSTGALYDHPAQAYKFGLLQPFVSNIDYPVQCQSIEDATEVCASLNNYKDYTKSTWHTFTTPAYFDYISVLVSGNNASGNNGYFTGQTVNKFGYILYEGDVTTKPIAQLTNVSGCDSLSSNGYIPDYRVYKCSQLKPNTTYTVQLFFKKNFNENFRLAVAYGGVKPTQAPEPILSKIPATNSFGVLPASANGILTTKSDQFACNSPHSLHPCSPSLPSSGIKYNGVNYNLSSFFTFTLLSTSRIDISASMPTCGTYIGVMLRLYKQNVSENCATLDTINSLGNFINAGTFDCLSPGTYTVQVLGSDSLFPKNYYLSSYGYLAKSTSPLCYIYPQFARSFDLFIRTYTRQTSNKYALKSTGTYDSINFSAGALKPLQFGVIYKAKPDTFGCENTVMPAGIKCNPANTKAMFREFVVGDADGNGSADSGVLNMNYGSYYNGSYLTYLLYKGDANALASVQNVNSYPDSIAGLSPYTKCTQYSVSCPSDRVCIVPGAYTFATFGTNAHVGAPDQSSFTLNNVFTKHYDGASAQNMGSLLDTMAARGTTVLYSDNDYFSCRDNAIDINGYKPCNNYGKAATKAIYRQFYLKDPSIVSLRSNAYNICDVAGLMTLFKGKATDGLSTLVAMPSPWTCFYNATSPDKCKPLDAGWYTVVSYGVGPNYENPFTNIQLNGYGSDVGRLNYFEITVTKACPGPKYNRPYKAAIDTVTKQPYLIQWKQTPGTTPKYPATDIGYTLYTENFNCTIDTPFSTHPIKACNTSLNRVAYYVFKTTQESYVQIKTQSYWAQVLEGDARKDSASFASGVPIQPCTNQNGYIQICRLQPGTYTLVVFAGDNNSCSSVTPTIYIDKIGYSRFDHANNAYDFGVVPPDSIYHKGKVGDVNPLDTAWAPSNDFFYCTTGAQKNDPLDGSCATYYNPNIYNNIVNNYLYSDSLARTVGSIGIPKRNLWYSFVVDKGGWVYVRVKNKTWDHLWQYRFGVYKSKVDGLLPFNTVVSSGKVDSTASQGLSFIGTNQGYPYCLSGPDFIKFYRDPCLSGIDRYYIIVENTNTYPYDVPGMNPNSQVEVEVMVDSINAIQPKFDHYYQASDMGVLGAGKYKGVTDNYSCATSDVKDPVYSNYACAKKTLWYKFTSAVTGHVRFQITSNGVTKEYSWTDVHLFREITKGDSTSKGLQILNTGNAVYYDNTINAYWGQQCISPGTYYLMLTGCNKLNEYVYPEIQILEDAGDFCSAPVVAKVNGATSNISSVIVDCHTIGTDYGEFNPLLTCPANAKKDDYKSSWFRIDIAGKDTLDVTVFLNEQTIAGSTDIKYRMMTGNCGAMQEQSCVQDALTQNTYKCLAPGNSYYIQVFTPVLKNGVQVTGSIDLNLKAVVHADTCGPIRKCLANANFTPQFDCKTDTAVRFVNFSTYGSSVINKWDFGYQGNTSTEISPAFFYPVLPRDTTYNVKLTIENTTCGEKDSVTQTVSVPGRPFVRLGNDTSLCTAGSSVILNATSFTGATYRWQDGVTTATYKATSSSQRQYSVKVTYNNCISTDTTNVFINPIAKQAIRSSIICTNDSANLSDYRGFGETYVWSNGAVTTYSQFVKDGGIYWVDLNLNGCTVRDSFSVTSIKDLHPLGNDTTVCQGALPYKLNATVSGATNYVWQDNTRTATYNITKAGTYWVDVTAGSCKFRDSVSIKIDSVKSAIANASICAGSFYTLPSGKLLTKAGSYKDTLRSVAHCDSLITTVTLKVDTAKFVITNTSICTGQTYKLPTGKIINTAGTYIDTLRNRSGCDSTITTVTLKINSATDITSAARICPGQTYTLPSGKKINIAGTYLDTVKSKFGCDSLYTTLTLTVFSASTSSTTAVICEGDFYTLPSGKKVSSGGVYKDTLRSSFGCDSLLSTVNLIVNSPKILTVTSAICDGSTYTLPSGKVVTQQGTYKDTVKSSLGCDSLITTTNVKVDTTRFVDMKASICSGAYYTLPSGQRITTDGIYQDTLRNQRGCDSLVTTLTLTVNKFTTDTSNVAICAGQTYTMPSGAKASLAGTYRDSLRSSAGCDSLISVIHLLVYTAQTVTREAFICIGDSYKLPSGITVNSSGIYKDTLRNYLGCDSLITTVNLLVGVPKTVSTSAVICDGQTYIMPGGSKVAIPGKYTDTLRSVMGCDSLITTVNLTVQSSSTATTNVVICAGQSYIMPSGKAVNVQGTYLDTLRYSTGCDSLVSTINVRVQSASLANINVTICEGQTYRLPSGRAVSVTGSYQDTLHYTSGCDSVITNVNLQVVSVTKVNTKAFVCAGRTYQLPSGMIVNSSGTYTDTLKNMRGCDSVITTTDLIVQTVTKVNVNAVICASGNYTLPSGRVVTTSGTYTDTVHYSTGCDSLISTVKLKVQSPSSANINAAVCSGQAYKFPSGKMATVTGTYQDTLRYASGCDSLITTVNLQVQDIILRNINASICAGQLYKMPAGLNVGITGTYKDTLKNMKGCDSLISTVNLVVQKPTSVTTAATVCAGQSYIMPSGKVASTPGTYADTLFSSIGCDSLITTINLSLKSVSKVNAAATICAGATYTLPSGKTVSGQAIYSDTLRYNSGCDSVITTVNLIVKPVTSVSASATICSGQTYTLPSGKVLNSAGIYNDTLRYINGCDSVITRFNLSVTSPSITNKNANICAGDTYQLPSGRNINTTGIYRDTIHTLAGCDSVITIVNLTVNPTPIVALSKSNDINCLVGTAQLTAVGGSRYIWSPASSLNNATIYNPVVFPVATTMYKVQVTSSRGCIAYDSIEVKVINGDPADGFLVPSAFTPNSDGKNDCFGVQTWGTISDLNFIVYDRWGITVFSTTDPSKCWDGTYKGEKLGTAAFVYQISAHTICGTIYRKGQVVLIR